jgi:hypothetical protein
LPLRADLSGHPTAPQRTSKTPAGWWLEERGHPTRDPRKPLQGSKGPPFEQHRSSRCRTRNLTTPSQRVQPNRSYSWGVSGQKYVTNTGGNVPLHLPLDPELASRQCSPRVLQVAGRPSCERAAPRPARTPLRSALRFRCSAGGGITGFERPRETRNAESARGSGISRVFARVPATKTLFPSPLVRYFCPPLFCRK